MPQISCGVNTCIHNKDCKCTLENPKISGKKAETAAETCCSSFSEKHFGAENSVETFVPSNNHIHCTAEKCRFYDKGNCLSSVVNVSGQGACDTCQTECRTFSKPVL